MTGDNPYKTPKFVSDIKRIEVDVSGIDTFGNTLHGEVQENFQPHVERLFKVYELGTTFGLLSYSPAVEAARKKHHECITQAGETLASYVNASKIMIAAIKKVSERYAGSDAFAADNCAGVAEILEAARLEANQARAKAARTMQANLDAANHGAPIHPSDNLGGYLMNQGVTTDG